MLADTREARAPDRIAAASCPTKTSCWRCEAPGVLYLEGHTDLEILRAFARVLGHPAEALLTTRLFWKQTRCAAATGRSGIKARDHYDALQLVRDHLRRSSCVDGEATRASGDSTQSQATGSSGCAGGDTRSRATSSIRTRSRASCETRSGGRRGASTLPICASTSQDDLPPAVIEIRSTTMPYLNSDEGQDADPAAGPERGGSAAIAYTRYHEIAALMLPEEIHPEVREKLDSIVKAFGR